MSKNKPNSAYARYRRGETMQMIDPLEPLYRFTEILRYPCGCEASGTYPLPTYCPTHGLKPDAKEGT